MSLYGGIKKIGSQSFQFDRIYPNRKAMQDAQMVDGGDGVYPGRYVLVEYGERYEVSYSEVNFNFDPNEIYYQQVGEDTYQQVDITDFNQNETYYIASRTEREDYRRNYDADYNAYKNVYDSTVWQKVYTKQNINENNLYTEKYIMVAELNALVPRLVLKEEETATLVKAAENEEEQKLYYGPYNELLHDVKEIKYNAPYFDEVRDTELEYILHMPKPLELDVNEDIKYHEEKFNIYQSYRNQDQYPDEIDSGNFIGWKPKPEKEQSKVIADSQEGGKSISDDTKFSKQELNMFLPAFGDVIGALYDTLFGTAATNGGIRPYFASRGVLPSDIGPDGSITNPTKFSDEADISKILANNSEGLAGILNALFTDTSIPGKVRYYLSADWLARNTDDDTNTPGILNKPKVIFANDDPKVNPSFNSQYRIEYSNWKLTSIFKKLVSIIVKVAAELAAANTRVKTQNSQSVTYNYNAEMAQENQNNAIIGFMNDAHKVYVHCAENELLQYYYKKDDSESHCWVGIQVDSADSNDTTLQIKLLDGSQLKTEIIENNQYLIWIPLDEFNTTNNSGESANKRFTLTSELPDVDDITFTIDVDQGIIPTNDYQIDDSQMCTVTYVASVHNPIYTGKIVNNIPKNGLYTVESIEGNFIDDITGTFDGILATGSYYIENNTMTTATSSVINPGTWTERVRYTFTNYDDGTTVCNAGDTIKVSNNISLTPQWSSSIISGTFTYTEPEININSDIYRHQTNLLPLYSNDIEEIEQVVYVEDSYRLNDWDTTNVSSSTTAVNAIYEFSTGNIRGNATFLDKVDMGYTDDENDNTAIFVAKDLVGWTATSGVEAGTIVYSPYAIIPQDYTPTGYYAQWENWPIISYSAVQDNGTTTATITTSIPYKDGISTFPYLSSFNYNYMTTGETFSPQVNYNGGTTTGTSGIAITKGAFIPYTQTGWVDNGFTNEYYNEDTIYASYFSGWAEYTPQLDAVFTSGATQENGIASITIPDQNNYYIDLGSGSYTYEVTGSGLAYCRSMTGWNDSSATTTSSITFDYVGSKKTGIGFQLQDTDIIINENLNSEACQSTFSNIELSSSSIFNAIYATTIQHNFKTITIPAGTDTMQGICTTSAGVTPTQEQMQHLFSTISVKLIDKNTDEVLKTTTVLPSCHPVSKVEITNGTVSYWRWTIQARYNSFKMPYTSKMLPQNVKYEITTS